MAKRKKAQIDQTEESIGQAINKTELFVEKYRNVILGAVIALLLIVAGVSYYNNHLKEENQLAQAELFRAEQLFAIDSFQLALGDELTSGFLRVIEEYGATTSGNLAQAYAGLSYLHLGQYEEALTHLNKFDTDATLISSAVTGAKGDCYMELGDFEKAAKFFKTASADDNSITAPFYLKKWGLALEKSGNSKKAAEVYTKIKDQYPSSMEAREVSKDIIRAQQVNQ